MMRICETLRSLQTHAQHAYPASSHWIQHAQQRVHVRGRELWNREFDALTSLTSTRPCPQSVARLGLLTALSSSRQKSTASHRCLHLTGHSTVQRFNEPPTIETNAPSAPLDVREFCDGLRCKGCDKTFARACNVAQHIRTGACKVLGKLDPSQHKRVAPKPPCRNKVCLFHRNMADGNKCNGCGQVMASDAHVRNHIEWGHCPATNPIHVDHWNEFHSNPDCNLFVSRPEGRIEIQKVSRFKYLGRILMDIDSDRAAVAENIHKAWGSIMAIKRNVFTRHLSNKVKVLIFNTIGVATAAYCSETWIMTKSIARRLDSFQQKGLRHAMKIHPTKVKGTLRYPKAEMVLEAAGEKEKLSEKLKKRTADFFSDIMQRGDSSFIKQVLDSAVIGTNKVNTRTSRLRLYYEHPHDSDDDCDAESAPQHEHLTPDRGTSGNSQPKPLKPHMAPIGTCT